MLAFSPIASASAPEYSKVTDPDAPRGLAGDNAVSVRWSDPSKFSEIRGSGNRNEAERGDWVERLATYLRDRAQRKLAAGERLDVTITDIRRAGNYEPWLGIEFDHVRIMKDLYWPRIALEIKRVRADGGVAAEGTRVLSDPSYLSGASGTSEGDSLRYEKAMIDRWLNREFASANKP